MMMRCLALGPSAVLAEFGFKQSGLIFRRTVGDVENVVECHLYSGWFVFELGANHHRVDAVLGNRRNKNPRPGGCTVNGRLNQTDDDSDNWWLLRPGHELGTAQHAAWRLRRSLEKWFSIANDLVALDEQFKGDHDEFWDSDMLAPSAIATVLGQVELGRERLEAVVRQINCSNEGLPRNQRSGSAVLEMARFMSSSRY